MSDICNLPLKLKGVYFVVSIDLKMTLVVYCPTVTPLSVLFGLAILL